MLSGEAINKIFIVCGLTQPGLEPTIYGTWGEHANHYTTYAVSAANAIQQHVNSANSCHVNNDMQSDCHSDSDSCAPEVMVLDARMFWSIMIWEWCSFATMFSQSLQLMPCSTTAVERSFSLMNDMHKFKKHAVSK